jgi:hypothetical protein
MRQIGVAIGLTVVLTFPVTVVSGAGSQKHSDQVRSTASGSRVPALMQGAGDVVRLTDRSSKRLRHGGEVVKAHRTGEI